MSINTDHILSTLQVTVLAIRATQKHAKIGMRESEVRRFIEGALSTAGLRDVSALTLFGGIVKLRLRMQSV